MKFSSMLLYVNDEFPTMQTFETLLDVGRKLYRKGKFLYSIEQTLIMIDTIGCTFNMITRTFIPTLWLIP